MDPIELVQTDLGKALGCLQRASDAYLRGDPMERFENLHALLSALIEDTFTHYCFPFFLKNDYFGLMARALQVYQARAPTAPVRLLSLAQLIISNTRTPADLNATLALPGFQAFFGQELGVERLEEAGDYFVNLVKSIILKTDARTPYAAVRPLLMRCLRLATFRDNLRKTTVRNIVLAVVNQRADSMAEFVAEPDLRCFFFDVLREIGHKFMALDAYVLKVATREVQNCLFEIQENLQFVDEFVGFITDEDLLCFMVNSFLVVVVVHLILPTFRADIKVVGARPLGINPVLFLLNLVLTEVRNEALNLTVAVDVVLKDKIHLISDPALLDSAVVFGTDYALLGKTVLFTNPKELNIFQAKPDNAVAQSMIKRPTNLFHTNEDRPGSRVVMAESIVPTLVNRGFDAEIPLSNCGGKVFQTLWAFFRSKDDNMILLTTNILLFLLTNYHLVIDQDIEKVTERLFDLLDTEPPLRHATNKNLGRLLYVIYDQLRFNDTFSINAGKLFASKVAKARKYFESPRMREAFMGALYRVANDPAAVDCVADFKVASLNWLALINYTFTVADSKLFSAIDLEFKMDLGDEEVMEVELRLLVIARTLRTFILGKQAKAKEYPPFRKLFESEPASPPPRTFREGEILSIDFAQKQDIKRYFGGKLANSSKKAFVSSLGNEIVLLEEVDADKNLFQVLFRELFANVTAAAAKGDAKSLVLRLRTTHLFWTLGFPTTQIASQSLFILEELRQNLRDAQARVVGEALGRLEGELADVRIKSYRIAF